MTAIYNPKIYSVNQKSKIMILNKFYGQNVTPKILNLHTPKIFNIY